MPLSKKRNAARMRIKRALQKGVQPSATQLVEVLSTNQRKERLAELIITPLDPEKMTAKQVVYAIDVYNKMDHVYTEPITENKVIVQTSIFILPDGRRLTAKQLKEGVEGDEA